MLLAEDGMPRLIDFGAAHMGDQPRMTQTGPVIGTYAYLSPEACNGEELDARTDIWSFGAMGLQAIPLALDVLTRVAELRVQSGETEDRLRATEMLSLVVHHAASEKRTRERPERLLSNLEAMLPSEALAAAQKRAESRQLEELAGAILKSTQGGR